MADEKLDLVKCAEALLDAARSSAPKRPRGRPRKAPAEPPAPKRPRGRPPSAATLARRAAEAAGEPAPPKRPRGRPPSAATLARRAAEAAVEPAPPKRGRGRPRKAPAAAVEPAPPKRGRGRPPSAATLARRAAEAAGAVPPKRGRGRPRKSPAAERRDEAMATVENIRPVSVAEPEPEWLQAARGRPLALGAMMATRYLADPAAIARTREAMRRPLALGTGGNVASENPKIAELLDRYGYPASAAGEKEPGFPFVQAAAFILKYGQANPDNQAPGINRLTRWVRMYYNRPEIVEDSLKRFDAELANAETPGWRRTQVEQDAPDYRVIYDAINLWRDAKARATAMQARTPEPQGQIEPDYPDRMEPEGKQRDVITGGDPYPVRLQNTLAYHGTHVAGLREIAPYDDDAAFPKRWKPKSWDSVATFATSVKSIAKSLYGKNVYLVRIPDGKYLFVPNNRYIWSVIILKDIVKSVHPDIAKQIGASNFTKISKLSAENTSSDGFRKLQDMILPLLRSYPYAVAMREHYTRMGIKGLVLVDSGIDLKPREPRHTVYVVFDKLNVVKEFQP